MSNNGKLHIPRRENPDPRLPASPHPTHDQNPAHPAVHDEADAGWNGEWAEPRNLRAPKPRPGMVQRWVRTAIRKDDDPGNVARAFQVGWKPRRADTVEDQTTIPVIREGRYAGIIGLHSTILCEMPRERAEARRRYVEGLTRRMNQSIDQDLNQQADPRMPFFQRRVSKVAVGRREPDQVPDEESDV